MPILLVLLILVFGSLVAAGHAAARRRPGDPRRVHATRVLSYVTDVSVFALNIITLIGLGMAIDYALFVVSRFREELAAGRDTRDGGRADHRHRRPYRRGLAA